MTFLMSYDSHVTTAGYNRANVSNFLFRHGDIVCSKRIADRPLEI
jgi:hypothetical protein